MKETINKGVRRYSVSLQQWKTQPVKWFTSNAQTPRGPERNNKPDDTGALSVKGRQWPQRKWESSTRVLRMNSQAPAVTFSLISPASSLPPPAGTWTDRYDQLWFPGQGGKNKIMLIYDALEPMKQALQFFTAALPNSWEGDFNCCGTHLFWLLSVPPWVIKFAVGP